MSLSTVIGIDNGVSGAVVALSVHTGEILFKSSMPSRKHVRKGNPFGKSKSARTDKIENEVDFSELVATFEKIDNWAKCIAIFEDCPDHAPSAASLRSMAHSAGVVCAALQDFGCPLIRIRPAEWQDKMLGKVPKGKTKEYALRVAKELWPQENWFATARSSAVHTGMLDSAIIGQYARLHKL